MPLTRNIARNYSTLALFLLLVVGGGWLIGATNLPGNWYAALAKPSFNPPNWLFAPVWTALYCLIAIAGWRTYIMQRHTHAMGLWVAQLVLNFAWSPVMFTMHAIGPALAIIGLLSLTIAGFIARQWRHDRVTAWLFIPYAAWVAFASLLNYSLYRLNWIAFT
jgi:tryptophan-rich sensory protein